MILTQINLLSIKTQHLKTQHFLTL